MSLWMLQTKTSLLWKVSYVMVLLGWWYCLSNVVGRVAWWFSYESWENVDSVIWGSLALATFSMHAASYVCLWSFWYAGATQHCSCKYCRDASFQDIFWYQEFFQWLKIFQNSIYLQPFLIHFTLIYLLSPLPWFSVAPTGISELLISSVHVEHS